MFSNYSGLGYFSFVAFVTSVVSITTFVLFFLRFYIFYKRGITFASHQAKLPKMSDIHLVFLALGIFVPFVLSFIPLLNLLVLIATIVIFVRLLSESLDNSSKLKPEKLAFIGAGFGIGGLAGFLLGFYRGVSYKEDTPTEMTPRTDNQQPTIETETVNH
jgi:hypothetical protein